MADAIDTRDFFISFNSADLAHAEAINSALKAARFTTYYHPTDIPPGGNIPKWMDHALKHSRQLLMLCSPEYMADGAVYSEAERYAAFWQNTRGKMIPVELRQAEFTPLLAMYKRVDAKNKAPAQAAAAVVAALKTPEEIQERRVLDSVQPISRIFNVLYRPNPNFTGRSNAMDALEKSLRNGNAAVTAVAGLGGVGKTTLAAEYCHRFGGRYGGVWWVRAEQEPVMLADLAALGQRLGLAATGNIEVDVRSALENLASRTEPWLMVYDNAPNADAVAKWLPIGAVRCLITSRSTSFDIVATVTRLDQWSDAVTADYLLARTGREDKASALRLAHVLDGLPLAAEQAGVFLKDRKGIGFDDYAKEIARLIKEEKPAGARGDYPDTVYAAFVKSLETLEKMKHGKTALDILRLCSFLSPDGVNLSLLLNVQDGEILPAEFAAVVNDRFLREDALAALASLSLIRQDDSPIGPVLIFHRLLFEVTRDWMCVKARQQWGSTAVRLLDTAFPTDPRYTPSNWPLCARLMPHIAPLELNAPHNDEAGKWLDNLLDKAGLYLTARGDRAGALAILEESVTLKRQTRTGEPLALASGLNNLGGRYADLGRLDDAETTYEEALAIKELYLEPSDPDLAITLSNLAQVYSRRESFAKAEPLLFRVEKIMKHAFSKDSAQYGHSVSDLGVLYARWGIQSGDPERLLKAEQYMQDALVLALANLGPRHPLCETYYGNLASLKAETGDWSGAVENDERAVAVMLSLDLAQHPSTAQRVKELLVYWQRSGQPGKTAQLQTGDISDLEPTIALIEAEHRSWVAEDPAHRHFGPPSPFAKKNKSAEPRRP